MRGIVSGLASLRGEEGLLDHDGHWELLLDADPCDERGRSYLLGGTSIDQLAFH